MDEILQEPVMQYVHKYLQAVGKAPAETDKFARQLYRLWFWSYGRGEARRASSGFEHVFIGEIDSKDGEKAVAGLHNWIQFYFLERSDALDYRGYVLPRKVTGNDAPDGDEQFLSVQFEWMGERKPVSGMFVGVSPEFEFALYTLLYYCGGEDNVVRLGDLEVNVKVYRLDRIGCISTAFPEAA
uniref:Poly-specific endoribonuclease-b-like n=1 Tax=Tetraselmis sp. GSL018 TaxID=582737 RepID=A0A061QJ22_9CHLO